MPLRHFTETALLLLLAVVTVVTGTLMASLPPLPAGLVPWAMGFVLALTYPLALYGIFRRNRADRAFRLLHFAPALLVLLWLLLALSVSSVPWLRPIGEWYTWAYGAIPVLLTLGLLALFSLHVIRRRLPRLSGLFVIALFLLGIGVLSEQRNWRREVASTLWSAPPEFVAFASASSKGTVIADTGTIFSKSADSSEESWRQKLRSVVTKSRATISASSLSSYRSKEGSSSVSSKQAPAKPNPHRLPQSGPAMDVLGTMMIAGYCGVLHRRAKMRAREEAAKLLYC